MVLAVVAASRSKLRANPVAKPFRPWAAIGAGCVDIAGTLSFTAGASSGAVAITTAASSALVIPPLVAGLVLFHERPAKIQYVGIAGVGMGLLLLGLGS